MTDAATRRTLCVGHASTRPAAVILDPDLTAGLSAAVTAATGMDAFTHALESYLSLRPNPWSDGLALQAIRMIGANLPRAVRDGTDTDARSQLLLAAHLAGVAFALSIGDTQSSQERNAAAAIDAVAALRDQIGLTAAIADFGITEADFAQIAADALADEVLLTTPRPPTLADIGDILTSRAG